MQGLHLTADLYTCRCDARMLTDCAWIQGACQAAVADAGLSYIGEKFFTFPCSQDKPAGVTGAILLAESHLALHTWPETGSVTLDVYVCNFTRDNSAKAEQLMRDLVARFMPTRQEQQRVNRGEVTGVADAREPLCEWLGEHSFFGIAGARRVALERSAHQTLEVFETPHFGKLLRLDGANMTSEGDEYFYHEALVHPLACAHPAPRSALVIGGGDGGAAEELLKHACMRRVLLVELDEAVPRLARQHFGTVHRGAFGDPRLEVHHADGGVYVRRAAECFDLIVLDLTDPDTPARRLYQPEFFRSLQSRLAAGGAVSLHIGSPVFHPQRFSRIVADLRGAFRIVRPYSLYVPIYGTQWGMAVASDAVDPLTLAPDAADERIRQRNLGELDYYNGEVHRALFALPNYVRKLLA